MDAEVSKMAAIADQKSTKADTIHKGGQRQRVDAAAFGARLTAAMERKGVKNAQLADMSGVSRQLVSEYANGQKVAGADNLFAIADSLGVYARWLLRGEGPVDVSGTDAGAEDVVPIPRYDVFSFDEFGRGEPTEIASVPRWLIAQLRSATGLWLAEMPSDALPEVAAEGDTIVCRDPDSPLQDRRVYIFLMDGRPIVRRVQVRSDGLLLSGSSPDDEITLRPDELDRLTPAGRVLGAITLNPA